VSWTLHLGDCLDPVTGLASLADKSVDVVITDPPYEAEAHTLQRRIKVEGGGNDYGVADTQPLTFPPLTEADRIASAREIGRLARQWAVVFCQVEAVAAWRSSLDAAGMTYRRAIPWVKPDAMPALHGRWPGQAFETIVIASARKARPCPGGGKSVFYSYLRHDVLAGAKKAPHPTTKPLALMQDLAELVSLPGDIILDPFAGSGTTGVAALMLGRRFIGWERDPSYHAIAVRRLNGDEAKPRPEQPSLWGGAA
jgi:site-specific DNA-methyltransferase (adenine-specific)